MAEVQNGRAVVWGCGNFEASGIIFSIAGGNGNTQSWDGERTSDVSDLLDGDGNTIGRAFYAFKKVINIEVMPCDNQGTLNESAAQTALDALLPEPGTVVTVVDSDEVADPSTDTIWETLHSGAWYVNSCSVRRTNNGPGIINMQICQYDDHDITAPVAA